MFKVSRRTAIRLYIAGIVASLATVGVVAFTATPQGDDDAPMYGPLPSATPLESQTLDFPRCSEASGQYDVNCWYSDAHTHMVVNFNHGEWTYDLDAQTMTHHKR